MASTGEILAEEVDRLANHEANQDIKVGLTHIDDSGKATMVDVGAKSVTRRLAVAKGSVVMQAATLEVVRENGVEKGDALGVARIAGIMGAKSTSQLIPLCHPLPLTKVSVDFELNDKSSEILIIGTG